MVVFAISVCPGGPPLRVYIPRTKRDVIEIAGFCFVVLTPGITAWLQRYAGGILLLDEGCSMFKKHVGNALALTKAESIKRTSCFPKEAENRKSVELL